MFSWRPNVKKKIDLLKFKGQTIQLLSWNIDSRPEDTSGQYE